MQWVIISAVIAGILSSLLVYLLKFRLFEIGGLEISPVLSVIAGGSHTYFNIKSSLIHLWKLIETVKFFRTQNSRCSFYFLFLTHFQTGSGFCNPNPNGV